MIFGVHQRFLKRTPGFLYAVFKCDEIYTRASAYIEIDEMYIVPYQNKMDMC